MKFLRLSDPLLNILFENEDIVAFDKPYGVNTHTNDSKLGQTEFVQDGLIELLEKQLGQKLHIVHRLDQTTTGVIIFGKTAEAAKKYAAFFFDREVKKTYWFITGAHSTDTAQPPPLFQTSFEIDQMILHKGREFEAKTAFCKLASTARFAKWEARPFTGRNHQIRIHAQAAGIALLGDTKYEGHPYPFLCLHNHKIEFPNGLSIISEAPAYFYDLKILEDSKLARIFHEVDRRQRLFLASEKSDQCLRLIHNKNDKADLGYSLDQFGESLLLSWYSERWTDQDRSRFSHFAQSYGRQIFIRLMHNRGKDPVNKTQQVISAQNPKTTPSEAKAWTAVENKIQYEIRSDSGQSFGLFLDQRLQRQWVRENSKDKSLLNLFSYTCGFSVAGAMGGASQVTSVDTNKNVLNWGKKNFELNSIPLEPHRFYCRDSITFLDQCVNKNQKFDLVICDPPSFSRGENGIFKIEVALETLIEKCLLTLNQDGSLLFSTNSEHLFIDDIRRAIHKVYKKIVTRSRAAPPSAKTSTHASTDSTTDSKTQASGQILNQELEIFSILSSLDHELPDAPPILKSFLIQLIPE